MTEELEMIIFSIVGSAGEVKILAHEALAESFKGNFEKAEELIKDAEKAILKAHNVQTDLIQKEAAGESIMLFVHAQDHIMTAMSEKELIKNLIKQNKKIKELEEKNFKFN